MANGTITPYQWAKFFRLISEAHSVRNACIQAKISRASAYNYKNSDAAIAERWRIAETECLEFLEDTVRIRAVEGVVKETGIYYKGELVQTYIETRYSDRLLLAMMGARDARYRTGNEEQIKQRVLEELSSMFRKLQQGLDPETYATVCNILASDEIMIDVTPASSSTRAAQITDTGND